MRFLRPITNSLLVLCLVGLGTFAFIPLTTYVYFAKDLTTRDAIMNRNDTGLILLDRNSQPFFTFYQGRIKTFTPLTKIPKYTQEAVISVEDKDFYSHPGFSPKAILRSLIDDIHDRKLAYGGSTITQQLIKNSLLNSRKNFLRKYQEIVLAQELERRFNKNQILEMYLNSVYFGDGAFGIEEAAEKYFNKPADQLTVAESALLAGLLPAPSQYSPLTGDVNKAKERQKYVLEKMTEQKYITSEQQTSALGEELNYQTKSNNLNSTAAHFAMLVRNQLVSEYGEETIARSGFKVQTTVDLNWQKYAEEVVKTQVDKLAPNRATNGAAVVIDPHTGEVKTLVGSKDWFNEKFGQVDIVESLRQPGSSFKPIVYAAALEKKLITPATMLMDQSRDFGGGYSPKDYDGKTRGPVLARRALANSLNIPSVEVMAKLGVPGALEMAKRLGITTLKDAQNYGFSLVLGAGEVKLLELTNAYATLANYGVKNDVRTVYEIKDKNDQVLFVNQPHSNTVLNPGVAFQITSILSDNKAREEVFGNTLTITRPAAVKTGTTENYRDAWTLGYTPDLVVGVWVGNNDGALMDNVAGSLGAAPIWKILIEKFSEGIPAKNFKPPSDVVKLNVCYYNGLVSKDASPSAGYPEYFLPGTEPRGICYIPPAPAKEDKKN